MNLPSSQISTSWIVMSMAVVIIPLVVPVLLCWVNELKKHESKNQGQATKSSKGRAVATQSECSDADHQHDQNRSCSIGSEVDL